MFRSLLEKGRTVNSLENGTQPILIIPHSVVLTSSLTSPIFEAAQLARIAN